MISSTLLFNKGIYKNTLRRFKWGSFLYFIMLFFSVPFTILVQDIDVMTRAYGRLIGLGPLLLTNSYIAFPMLLAIVVPTVVAALAFNNVHSQKQSIFVHSLPVTRGANYVSTLLSAFTLMALPVIANALILLIMSLSAYGQIITSASVIYWAALNLSVLFIMFSFAAFSAYLTGNTAAHIAINVFLHVVPMLIALTIHLISDIFLFGFIASDNFIANEIMSNTPIVWLFSNATNHYRNELNMFALPQMWIYLAGAAVIYALGFVLYKKRKIEACGDVAAFKIFKPILKYSVTTAAAVAAFGMLASSDLGAVPVFIVAIAVTLVVYFAAEMLLSKTVRVFGKYKGYLGFMAAAALFISFFAFTSVCGYETRIPDKEDIAKASVYARYLETKPVLADSDIIDDCIELHKCFISNIPITVNEPERYLFLTYELKNGRTINRRYPMSNEMANAALSKMYEYEEYKILVTEFDKLNIENVTHLTIGLNARSIGHTYTLSDSDAAAFLRAIEKDVRELSYADINVNIPAISLSVSVGISKEENDRLHYFKDEFFGEDEQAHSYHSFNIGVNANFKNAFAFLNEKGYYQDIISRITENLSVLKTPVTKESEVYSYKNDYGEYHEFQISTDDLVYLSDSDAKAMAELIMVTPDKSWEEGSYYYLYSFPHGEKTLLSFNGRIAAFSSENLPEILVKYVGM